MLSEKSGEISLCRRENSICWRGIAALFVMYGHLLPKTANLKLRFFSSGALWVGLFFFYSGYGTQFSFNQNKSYLDKFIKKKIVNVWLPFILAESLYTIVMLINGRINVSFTYVLLSCMGIYLQNTILWYVVEILGCYLLFYLLKKNYKTREINWIWILIYLIFLSISVALDVGNWWYISSFCFVIGIYTCEYSKQIARLGNNKLLGLLTVVMTICLYCVSKEYSEMVSKITGIPVNYVVTACQLILVPLFVFSLMFIDKWAPFLFNNIVFRFIGDLSYELYLYHMLISIILKSTLEDNWNTMLLTYIITILVASFIKTIITQCRVKKLSAMN